MNNEEYRKNVINKIVNSDEFMIIEDYISSPYIDTIEEIDNELNKYKKVIYEIKRILKDYGRKEDISNIGMYYIQGEYLIGIIELLEEIE